MIHSRIVKMPQLQVAIQVHAKIALTELVKAAVEFEYFVYKAAT